jgi:hypothetical protein
MLDNQSFNYYDIPYVHQCNNSTVEVFLNGVKPNPAANNNPLIKKEDPVHRIFGSSQCGVSSLVMLCNYWLKLENKPLISGKADIRNLYTAYDKDLLDDKTRDSVFEKQNNYNNLFLQIFASKNITQPHTKFESVSSLNLTAQELLDALDSYGPVITNGRYTPKGHYILLKGWSKEEQSFVVHDPYFEFNFKTDTYFLESSKKTGEEKLYPYTFVESKSKASTGRGIRAFYIKRKI